MDDPRLRNHFTIFLLPFRHRVSDYACAGDVAPLLERWSPWFVRLDEENLAGALDDSYFFLDYARESLFPELARYGSTEKARTDLCAWVSGLQALPEAERKRAYAGLLATAGDARPPSSRPEAQGLQQHCAEPLTCRHLTLDGASPLLGSELRLFTPPKKDAPSRLCATFQIEYVDALLFPEGVGLLCMKVKLLGDDVRLAELSLFHKYARQVLARNIRMSVATVEVPVGDEAVACTMAALLEYLIQDLKAPAAGATLGLAAVTQIVDQGLDAPGYTPYVETPFGQVFGERLPFVAYINPDWEEAPPAEEDRARILFEAAHTYAPSSTITPGDDYQISRSRLGVLDQDPGWISLWADWSAFAAPESCVFMGFADSRPVRNLEWNVGFDYFNLYVWAMHQKLQLYRLSRDLITRSEELRDQRDQAERCLRSFFQIRNRWWFAEVTKRPQGVALFAAFQTALGTESMFDVVATEARDLREHYEECVTKATQAVLDILTFFFAPVSLLLTFFTSDPGKSLGWWWVPASLGVLVASWYWWSQRARTRKGACR